MDPQWREQSKVVGSLGFYGPGRHLERSNARSPGADYVTKIGVVIEGDSPITVSIAPRDRPRAALIYRRGIFSIRQVEKGDSSITFEPCLNSDRTAWAGGFVLKDRGSISLVIAEPETGMTRTISLGS